MKILIAYDGSEYADAAIEDLSRAGLPAETEAMVLSVSETWLPARDDCYVAAENGELMWHWRRVALERVAECEKLADQAVLRVREKFPAWNSFLKIASGYPEWAITAEADKFKPDLIVIGPQGRGNIGSLWLGSVSLKVLSEARCSVRLSRRLPVQKNPDGAAWRIIIGVDGSPDSQSAIEVVASRKWKPGTEVQLVTAIEPSIHPIYDNHPIYENETHKSEELHKQATVRLRQTGLRVSSVIRHERAKRLLVEEAESWKADTIFLGAKGHRFLERILLGSVSYAVASRAHCSVEVVRGE